MSYADYLVDRFNSRMIRFQEEILDIAEELRKLRKDLCEIGKCGGINASR